MTRTDDDARDWSDCFDAQHGAHGDVVLLRVHVQPRAGRSGVVGRHGDALKLRVAAPPVDDRANAAVIELVASMAGVAPSAVGIVGGGRSRAKRVRIDGVDPGYLSAAIAAAVASRA
jgi:uncharacterized protein (TIGR00251 family)